MNAPSELIIDIRNLTFSYRPELKTLDIAHLEIKKSEKIFLHGPSGCGKSTLLEILAGIQKSDTGQVQILGKNLALLTAREKDFFRASHIGYIFQNFNLIPYLDVKENILLPLYLSSEKMSRVKNNLSQDLEKLIRELHLQDILDKKSFELSVGQQQRVAVARALLGRPELILADEPTSALDYENRERFLKLMFNLCDQIGATVIFVSHDLSLKSLFSRTIDFKSINQVNL